MKRRRVVKDLQLSDSSVSRLDAFVFFSWAYGHNIIVFDIDMASATEHLQNWLSLKGLDRRLIPLDHYTKEFAVSGPDLQSRADNFIMPTLF